jgi:hypothetical protein
MKTLMAQAMIAVLALHSGYADMFLTPAECEAKYGKPVYTTEISADLASRVSGNQKPISIAVYKTKTFVITAIFMEDVGYFRRELEDAREELSMLQSNLDSELAKPPPGARYNSNAQDPWKLKQYREMAAECRKRVQAVQAITNAVAYLVSYKKIDGTEFGPREQCTFDITFTERARALTQKVLDSVPVDQRDSSYASRLKVKVNSADQQLSRLKEALDDPDPQFCRIGTAYSLPFPSWDRMSKVEQICIDPRPEEDRDGSTKMLEIVRTAAGKYFMEKMEEAEQAIREEREEHLKEKKINSRANEMGLGEL